MDKQTSKISIHTIFIFLLTCSFTHEELINISSSNNHLPSVSAISQQILQLVPVSKMDNTSNTSQQSESANTNSNKVAPISIQHMVLQPIKFPADNFTTKTANQLNTQNQSNFINYGGLTLYDLAFRIQSSADPIQEENSSSFQSTQKPNISVNNYNNSMMNTAQLSKFNSQMLNIASQISNTIANLQTLKMPVSNPTPDSTQIMNNLNSVDTPNTQNLYQYITNKLQPKTTSQLINP